MKMTVKNPLRAYKQLRRDLADGKQAEQQLVALSSRHEAILAAIPDIIMEVDTDKIYTWANTAGFAFFGDDVIGKEAAFYFVGEQATSAVVQPQFDDRQDVVYVRSWQRRKDGEARLLAWQCRAIKDEDGNVSGVLSSARDITERKLVEENLRKKEHLLSESQRLGHIGSFLYDATGSISWSEEVYRIFGVSADTFAPNLGSLLGLLHPDDRSIMQAWISGCAAGENPEALDYRIIKPDGSISFIRGWGKAVHDEERRLIHISGMVQDITEQKRNDEIIQRFITELANKNKELQVALANVKQLTGLLPICASCKQIRDDQGYWQGVEMYISKHSEVQFSHGICPECEKKVYEELEILKERNAWL